MTITRVLFSNATKRWYLQINNLEEIAISKEAAGMLIKKYELLETSPFRWEKIQPKP
jgi:hypothetical protein